MGQDIHIKNWVYSKVEYKLINCCDIFERDPKYSEFPDLFIGRSYDLFSLFGSLRSDYPQLSYINYGLPPGLPKTFKEYIEKYSVDFHTFSYFTLPDLRKALMEYVECLKNPAKFYLMQYGEDEDEEIKERILNLKEWNEDNSSLRTILEDMIHKIDLIYEDAKTFDYGDLIDLDKSIIMFWFDN